MGVQTRWKGFEVFGLSGIALCHIDGVDMHVAWQVDETVP